MEEEKKQRLWSDQEVQKSLGMEQEDTSEDEEYELEIDIKGRKVGAARFFQITGRDFLPFYSAGFLFLLGILPGLLLVYAGMMADSLLLSVCGGGVAGLIGGPCLCGLLDTILRSLREEAGYWWHTYKRAWRQNWKQSLIPGVFFGLFGGVWSWVMIHMPDMEGIPTAIWVCMIMGMLLAVVIGLYLFSQIVLVSLDLKSMLLNSALFFYGYLPRSLAAGLVICVYWGATALYLPYTVPVMFLTGAWFPAAVGLLCVYPALNRSLHIEEELDKKMYEMYE